MRKKTHVFCLTGLITLLSTAAFAEPTYRLVRTYPEQMPLNFMGNDGSPSGFETELIQEIARRSKLDFKEEFAKGTGSVLQRVREDKADLGIGAITVTSERRKIFDFSEPYLQVNPITILTKNPEKKTIADLANEPVSCEENTMHEEILKSTENAPKSIFSEKTDFLAVKKVLQDKAVATIGDDSYMFGFLENYKDEGIRLFIDPSYEKEHYAIAFKKGDTELKNKVDNALRQMKSDGTYQQLLAKWYPNKK